MFNKLKELKDLRDQGKKMKEMMDEIVVVGGSSGSSGNKVMVTLNGSHELLGVQIDDDLDRAKIADGVKDAFADANRKLQTELMKKMKDMGGLGGLGDMMKGIGG